MDNKYELFLSNAVVINVRSEKEFKDFIQLMKNLGLAKVNYMKRIYDKYGFEKGFCYNAGVKYCNQEDICFEYQIGKGFTFSSIKNYTKNDYFKVCSLEDILIDTGYCIKADSMVIKNSISSVKENNISNENLAKRYSLFVEHYESYLKENKNELEEEFLKNSDPNFVTIYKLINEDIERKFYPWRFFCQDNIELSLSYIFKNDIGKTYQLLCALDIMNNNYFSPAIDELERYYKKENIDFDSDKVINVLENFKAKEDLEPKIFSKETIDLFDLYNESNSLSNDLYTYYESMRKNMDLELEIEK